MIHAAQRRLRPIVMTAIAAVCGMLPLAFAIGGVDPIATLAPAVVAFVLCVLFTARLALGLSGSRSAGIGAGAAFALSPWALRLPARSY